MPEDQRRSPAAPIPDAPIPTAPIEDQEIMGAAPVVVRRYVKWGDTDFARVIYTPRVLDYVIEATEIWFKLVAGEPWAEFVVKRGLSSPAVSCGLDFHHPMRADDRLDLTVLLDHIGRSSHRLSVSGDNQDGIRCFDGQITYVVVDPAALESRPIPEDIARRFHAYRQACDAARQPPT